MSPEIFALYKWTRAGKHWTKVRQAETIAAAVPNPAHRGIIVDLLGRRVVWKNGIFCNRALPAGMAWLPSID